MNSIDIFPWNENFNTGLSVVDEQHKKLVQLLNLLASHVAFQSDLPALNIIFDELADYAAYHFKTEEAIWHKFLADESIESKHKEVHDSFITSVQRLKAEGGSKSVEHVVEEVLSFLARWLAAHILENDRYMALVVLAMQAGLSLPDAQEKAKIQLSGTMRVLIDIILSTYSSLATNTLHLMREISEHKQAEHELKLAHQIQQENLARIQSLMDSSLDGVISMDHLGRVVGWNSQAERMFGYAKEQALGRDLGDLIVPEQHREAHRNGMARFMATSSPAIIGKRVELSGLRADGTEFPMELTVAAHKQQGHYFFSAYARDITDRKVILEQIEHLAFFDQLTQLPNRRLFQDRLEQAIRKARRDQCLTALLFIDLDHFKEVNDTLGHETGDLLLVEAAARIKACIRSYDTLARMGGDEFTVVLTDIHDASDIGQIATNIINQLARPFTLRNQESFVSASVGIAIYPDDAETASELIQHADQAMYAAKNYGRDRFQFFTKALQESADLRLRLAGDLRRALSEGQFDVYYQPIIDLRSGQICKAEALLRWKHPEHGFINPGAFIPIAEDTGVIHEIGDWVFTQATEQLIRWQTKLGVQFQISVNKSPVQFMEDGRKHERWINHLRDMGLSGSGIVIEITEGLLMNADPGVTNKLLKFQEEGIEIAIDDFGTGYSSLAYLKKFDIDYLKIDQSFTRNLAVDSPDFALCEAIVMMAHKLGLKVVAEGVETEQQRDLLNQIHCDFAQGFLFSKAVPAEEFERLLMPLVHDPS